MRVVSQDGCARATQLIDDRKRGREGQLFDVLAIGEAEDEDALAGQTAQGFLQPGQAPLRHPVVDRAGEADEVQLAVAGIAPQQMRLDGNTVAADADAGPVQVRERLAAGSLERLLPLLAPPPSLDPHL